MAPWNAGCTSSGWCRGVTASARRLPAKAEPCHQLERIERRLHLHVVVEVDVHVLAGAVPGAAPSRPLAERAAGVAAAVDLHVAVQPHIDEVPGDVAHLRPLA